MAIVLQPKSGSKSFSSGAGKFGSNSFSSGSGKFGSRKTNGSSSNNSSIPHITLASGHSFPVTAPLAATAPRSNSLQEKSYIAPSSSAKSVASDSFTSASVGDVLDRIQRVSNANTAQSAQLAAEQRDWQAQQNKIAMDFNAAEAAKNRDWQQMMSNTAHQREVADLRAAGLNPVLSATGGNGAAVTSGATASGVTSAGARGDVDTSFAAALMNFLNNMMGYATSTASAGISAGAVMGAANINSQAAMFNSILSNVTSASNTKYTTDNAYKRQKDQQDFEALMRNLYPSNPYQMFGSGLDNLAYYLFGKSRYDAHK